VTVYSGPHFGFPSIIHRGSGDLAVYYNDQVADGTVTKALHSSISTDRGSTWVDGEDVWAGPNSLANTTGSTKSRWSRWNVWSTGCTGGGFRAGTGTLLLPTVLTVRSGTAYQSYAAFWRSTDDGATWFMSAKPLFDSGYAGNGTVVRTGLQTDAGSADDGGIPTSPPVQIVGGDHDGRLLAALYGKKVPGEANSSVSVLFSDDDGLTWDFLAYAATGVASDGGINYTEPCMATLDNGTIFMMLRVGAVVRGMGTEWRAYVTSSDGGATWSAPVRLPFTGQSGRPDILQLSVSSVGNSWGDLIHFLRPRDFERLLLFSISHDRGVTWTDPAVLASASDPAEGLPHRGGRSAYCQPVEIAPGTIGVAYGLESTDREIDYPGAACFTRFKKIAIA